MPQNLVPARPLHEITAAMNAYPWTRGRLSAGPKDAPGYCAMGALLRYAGVPQARIANGTLALADEYASVLRDHYGISGDETVRRIMVANDSAESREEAIWGVLGLVSGVVDANSSDIQANPVPEFPPAA